MHLTLREGAGATQTGRLGLITQEVGKRHPGHNGEGPHRRGSPRSQVNAHEADPMPDDNNHKLDDIRQEIDSIDAALVDALNRRAGLAAEIGKLKGRDNRPFFTPERERAIYEKLAEINEGPLQRRQLVCIFREIISAARALEKPLNVAYWGPPGTFTHLAAIQTFGGSTTFQPQESIQDSFMAVEHGDADYGVVPVENSVAGVVPETLDMFPQTKVKICAETYVPIHHHLVTTAKSLDDIQRIYAGPQPGGQCKRWLRANVPNAEVIETVPTARAAERALADPNGAAIANRLGAETVGIPILVEHIEDNPHNRTRFLVVGYNEPAKTGRDKTSLMFNLRHRPGELYHALGALFEEGVNLMMIESRPAARTTFEYIFYCDCVGHRSDKNMQLAIARLKECALETTILGSYPCVDPLEAVG
jgi:chorismate mutase/prephenate dehydratase